MAATDGDPQRRIMNALGEGNRIPVVNVAEGDVGVLFGAPIAGLFLATLSGLDVLLLPCILVGLTVGVAIVYAAPPHLTAWDWLEVVLRFYLVRPRVTHSHPPDSDHAATDGGMTAYSPFTPSERTQDLTNVQQAWPGAGAIERTDGRMEAFLEVEPANMDQAMSGDWESIQRTAAGFANNEVEFPLTMYVTTESFPVDTLVATLEDRLSDPDVQDNPAFRKLIAEYRERRPADLADAREFHYYIGVSVSRLDVHDRHEAEPTPGEKLRELPLVGALARPFVARRNAHSEAELRAAMVDRLDARLATVESELVEKVNGWSASRLSTIELFLLAMEYWNGEELDQRGDERVRTMAALGRQARDTEADA